MVVHRLLTFPKQASSEARKIVLDVIKAHKEPLSTRDVFNLAVKVPAEPIGEPLTTWSSYLKNSITRPSHPDHPVRSLSYLKRTILDDLVRTRDVQKVHIKQVLSPAEIEERLATMSKKHAKKASVTMGSEPVSTWVWQLADKSTIVDKKKEKEKGVFGREVGAGKVWGHLNKRRGRART